MSDSYDDAEYLGAKAEATVEAATKRRRIARRKAKRTKELEAAYTQGHDTAIDRVSEYIKNRYPNMSAAPLIAADVLKLRTRPRS